MRKKVKGWSLGFSVAAIGVMGVAAAQPDEDYLYQLNYGVLAPPKKAKPTDDKGPTLEEMQAQVEAFLPAMQQESALVQRQINTAREQRDVVKLLCLNDKLLEITMIMKTGKGRLPAFSEAVRGHNLAAARHEFAVLGALREKARGVGAESNQCIGEDAGIVGEASFTTTVDPSIAAAEQDDHDKLLPDSVMPIPPPPVVRSPIR